MRYIFLALLLAYELLGGIIKAPILSIDDTSSMITVKVESISVGVTGFVVHSLAPNHTTILKSVEVVAYDPKSKLATLKMSEFNTLRNNALPTGEWQVKVGDGVELAFGYTRALLVAPSEEIYHQVTKAVKTQWIHPDIFATILSYRGHPTPLKEDFMAMNIATSSGLLFIYLNKKLFTVDMKSFKILSINDAPLVQDSVKLPFYSRIEEIEANWWGEGSDELTSYEPHYYELLAEYNPRDEKLYSIIKNGDKELHYLLEKFEIGK